MAAQPDGEFIVHAFVITAKPTRWQRCVRAAAHWVPRLLIGAGMVLLGIVVFAIRTVRAIANLVAHHAARLEYALAARTGRQPVGQTIGVGVTAAFVAEFHRARTEAAA